MNDYPLMNLFLTMMWLFLWILWFFLLFRIITDIFRSDDMGGWSKALWTLFIIILPFLGVLIYVIVRGKSMGARDRASAAEAETQFRSYVRDAAASSSTPTDELTKLAALHQQGHLTDAEFAQQKARILGTPAAPAAPGL
ncbi:SHOCT domain-containing protein [Xylanimonas sp. McL0601]|uniref:SHOCT domain-containing protein n=1 Tax=Xylanimonas sp. McL0601 TaxID=3414739 RepID=UPI003CF9E13C